MCALRSVLRHRKGLVQIASTHVQHMQKALDQMNLQLHHVISDITGLTGTAIMEAILKGERDPVVLSKMRDRRIKASAKTVAVALVGDFRREHLFALRQSLEAHRQCQHMIAACDSEIDRYLTEFDSKVDVTLAPLCKPKDRHKPRRNEMRFDLRTHLYRIYGVDLTEVPGINALTAHVLFAEIGPDLSRFANGSAFASWLGLCPDNRISGGKILSVKTRVVKNRAAMALRLAAQVAALKPVILGKLLPADASETRHPESDHRRRSQACSHRVPPPHNAAELSRKRFYPLRNAAPKPDGGSASTTGTRVRPQSRQSHRECSLGELGRLRDGSRPFKVKAFEQPYRSGSRSVMDPPLGGSD